MPGHKRVKLEDAKLSAPVLNFQPMERSEYQKANQKYIEQTADLFRESDRAQARSSQKM